jgi:hypothetical protein
MLGTLASCFDKFCNWFCDRRFQMLPMTMETKGSKITTDLMKLHTYKDSKNDAMISLIAVNLDQDGS